MTRSRSPFPGRAHCSWQDKDKSKSQKVSFKLRNLAASTVWEAAVTMQLPPYVRVKSGLLHGLAARFRTPTISTVTGPCVSLKALSGLRFITSVKTIVIGAVFFSFIVDEMILCSMPWLFVGGSVCICRFRRTKESEIQGLF